MSKPINRRTKIMIIVMIVWLGFLYGLYFSLPNSQ
jgi:hypothetical protein